MTIQAPIDKLRRLRELQERDRIETAARARADYPTPGALAQRLDPSTIQTSALDIIDAELIMIRDALEVMFARRARYSELTKQGVPVEIAAEQAAVEIASAGNDRLIVSAPPQDTGKSQRITRYGLLWLLRQFPKLRIGIVSYDGDVAAQFSWQVRGDIELFGSESETDLGLRLVQGQKAMSRWVLTTGGSVYAIGIGGGLTSRPFDLICIDDPVKDYRAADSLLVSSQAWEWWQSVARPRLAPWAPVIEVATRWHEADLAGRMISKQAEDEAAGIAHYDRWRVLNIPAQADHDPNKGEVDILGREPGEFMASARGRTVEQWEATKAATAPRFWSALYQGRPTPDVGDIWLREWWRRYDTALWTQATDGTYRLDGYDVSQSWDFAFRDTKASDFVVGQVWAKKGADSFLIYQVWARLSFTASIEAMRRVTRLFPQSRRKIIEGKANGDAVVDSLKHEIPGIIVFTPGTGDSKVARATATSPFIRAGNVHLPTVRVATMQREIAWDVEAFIQECTSFPNGAHDDQTDGCSQYLHEAYLVGGEATFMSPQGDIPRNRGRNDRMPRMTQAPRPAWQKALTDQQMRRP